MSPVREACKRRNVGRGGQARALLACLLLGCGGGQATSSSPPTGDANLGTADAPPAADVTAAPDRLALDAVTDAGLGADGSSDRVLDAAPGDHHDAAPADAASIPDGATARDGPEDAPAPDQRPATDAPPPDQRPAEDAPPPDQRPTREGVPTRTCAVIGLGPVRSIVSLPDGSGFIAGSGASVAKLFRASDGADLRTFIGHEAEVNAVAV